jgi:hypothetical protein
MDNGDLWAYSDDAWIGNALVGLKVEATDGEIGTVDGASDETSANWLVVDTGSWIFGKKVLLPAGIVERVDFDDERVFVNRSKDEIENAPEYDEDRVADDAYRGEFAAHYGDRARAGDV